MKPILHTFALIYCLAYMAIGAPVTVDWDPAENATSYEVWRGIDLLAIVSTPQVHLDLPEDQLTALYVRSVNAAGTSEPSETFTIQPIRLQNSQDMQTWEDHPVRFIEFRPKMFFRVSFPTS